MGPAENEAIMCPCDSRRGREISCLSTHYVTVTNIRWAFFGRWLLVWAPSTARSVPAKPSRMNERPIRIRAPLDPPLCRRRCCVRGRKRRARRPPRSPQYLLPNVESGASAPGSRSLLAELGVLHLLCGAPSATPGGPQHHVPLHLRMTPTA